MGEDSSRALRCLALLVMAAFVRQKNLLIHVPLVIIVFILAYRETGLKRTVIALYLQSMGMFGLVDLYGNFSNTVAFQRLMLTHELMCSRNA